MSDWWSAPWPQQPAPYFPPQQQTDAQLLPPPPQAPPTFAQALQHQQQWGMPPIADQLASIAGKTGQFGWNLLPPVIGAKWMAAHADDAPGQTYVPDAARGAADVALNLMGSGMLGAERGALGSAGGSIKAYHGSPHDFDKFDLSKIGTGEGAQVYGHGLYFAENPKVAESYKKQYVPNGLGPWNPANMWTPEMVENKANPGRMYEVNIKADPERFLDWDKPLSEQPESFKRLKDAGVIHDKSPPSQKSGQATPRAIVEMPEDPAAITTRLREAGIPGIKYADQGSRGKGGEGSRNYVVFDDKLIDIMKKYGIAGIGALPAMGAYHFQDNGS